MLESGIILPADEIVIDPSQTEKVEAFATATKSPNNPVGSFAPNTVSGAVPSPTIAPLILTLGLTLPVLHKHLRLHMVYPPK